MKNPILILVFLMIYNPLFSQIYYPKQDYATKKWGYVDQNQKLKIPFKYDEANRFHLIASYFAEVKIDNILYLIDTFGNEFRLAKDVKDLSSQSVALYINSVITESIPDKVFENKQLKIVSIIGEYEKTGKIIDIPAKIGNLTNLTHLFLSENQTKTLPKEIGNLSNLLELQLQNNQINKLPKEIGNLSNLLSLNLSNNQLKNIPKEIGKLKNLKNLILSVNQFNTFPAEIEMLRNLYYLDLAQNQLKSFPKEICHLKNLKFLDLSNNSLSEVPKEIGELSNLEGLYLTNTSLTKLPTEIQNLKKLGILYLNDNSFTDIEMEQTEENCQPDCRIIWAVTNN